MKFILGLALLFATLGVETKADNAPYNATLRHMIEEQSTAGQKLQRFVRATWDSSFHGTASSTDMGLGQFLPAGAVITRSYLYVNTQQTYDNSHAAPTTEVFCEDANNIKTATNISGSANAAFIEGQSTGAASAFVGSIANRCEIKVNLHTFPVSTGKFTVFVSYIVP